jgi:AraC-like DNA-binding protein
VAAKGAESSQSEEASVEIQSLNHGYAEHQLVATLAAQSSVLDAGGICADASEPSLILRGPKGTREAPADLLVEPADPVVDALMAVLRIARCRPGGVGELFISNIERALQTHLTHASDPSGGPPKGSSAKLTPSRERRAKEFLTANAGNGVSVAEAAAACRLSRGYFTKAFKDTTGDTPFRWLIKHRVKKAKELLRGPQTIAQIAIDCGFSDQSHLTRVFSKIVGVSPGSWRRTYSEM